MKKTKKIFFLTLATATLCIFCLGANKTLAGDKLSDPSDLIASPISNTQINLAWSDNSTDESGFLIEISLDGKIFNEIAQASSNTTFFENTDLTPGTNYYYRVRAYRVDPEEIVYSKYSKPNNATTAGSPADEPISPSSLRANAVSYSQIDITWQDNSDNEDGFLVERSLDGDSFVQIADVSADTTTYSDNGLYPETNYYYRVRAYRIDDVYTFYSSYSNDDSTKTLDSPVADPSGLDLNAVSYSQINLAWQDNSDNEDGFAIERSLDGDNFVQIAEVASNTVSYSDINLEADTLYHYQVRAYKQGSSYVIYSDYSNSDKTETLSSPISDPSDLVAGAVSYSQIDLAWQDNSDDEDGFTIERSLDGDNFIQIAEVASNTVSYSDINLEADTLYHYQVRAYREEESFNVYSNYSNEGSDTTLYITVLAPSDATAETVSYSQINVFWQDNADNETGFLVERSLDGTNFTQIADVGADSTGYLDTGLIHSTTYYYRLRAYRDEGGYTFYSSYSKSVNTITSPSPVISPTNLSADAVSYSQIDLTWQDNSDDEDGFTIERSLDGNNFVEIAEVTTDTASYSNLGLISNKTFYYRIKAYRIEGDGRVYSEYSNIDNNTTLPLTVQTPNALVANAIHNSQIDLAWQDNSDNETGFLVERSLDGVNFFQIEETTANVTTYINSGLVSETDYYYRARAYRSETNETVYSSYSAVVSTTTPAPSAIPAPSNLAVSNVGYFNINLSWQDNSDTETNFLLERGSNGVNFTQIVQLGENVTSYSDTDLTLGTTYYYRIRAKKAEASENFYSEYSNQAVGTTTPFQVIAPSDIYFVNVSYDHIRMKWSDNSDNETKFLVEKSEDGINFVQIASIEANTTEYLNDSLVSNTTYYYRIRAQRIEPEIIFYSDYSEIKSTTTPMIDLNAPTDLTVVSAFYNQINIAWNDDSQDLYGFSVERSLDGVNFAPIAEVEMDDLFYSDTFGIEPKTTYYYRVKTKGIDGSGTVYSDYSETVSTSTPGLAPPSLTVTSEIYGEIKLAWEDNYSVESGYLLERSLDGNVFTQIADLPADTVFHIDTYVENETTYYYRIRVYSPTDTSDYSSVVSETTEFPPLLQAPSNLTFINMDTVEVRMIWQDNSEDEDFFLIEKSDDGVNFYQIGSTETDVNDFSDFDLVNGAVYYYRVRAQNDLEDISIFSDYSNVAIAYIPTGN